MPYQPAIVKKFGRRLWIAPGDYSTDLALKMFLQSRLRAASLISGQDGKKESLWRDELRATGTQVYTTAGRKLARIVWTQRPTLPGLSR